MTIRPKTLIVDDMTSMRKVIGVVMKTLGFIEIVEAEDGQVALAKLRGDPTIGFVISDWNMPVMDGLTLLIEIKRDENLKHLPVMMLTAEGLKDNVIAAVQAGAIGYIVKPFTPATFAAKIEAIAAKFWPK
jgi:two-component system chemotaxis response regulator CheY